MKEIIGAQAKQHNKLHVLQAYILPKRARGGAVGRGTALQAGKSRVHFPDMILGPEVDSAPNRTEYQKYFLGGKGSRCLGLTYCADCLESGSLNLLAHFGSVRGLYRDCFKLRVIKSDCCIMR
jgi:hypothetical protein